jgi:hypothetical protein
MLQFFNDYNHFLRIDNRRKAPSIFSYESNQTHDQFARNMDRVGQLLLNYEYWPKAKGYAKHEHYFNLEGAVEAGARPASIRAPGDIAYAHNALAVKLNELAGNNPVDKWLSHKRGVYLVDMMKTNPNMESVALFPNAVS